MVVSRALIRHMPLPDATAPARMALRQDHAHDAVAEVHTMFLDIVLLRPFVAVVEANGFTRAAGFVNLTQSAVSLAHQAARGAARTPAFRSHRSEACSHLGRGDPSILCATHPSA